MKIKELKGTVLSLALGMLLFSAPAFADGSMDELERRIDLMADEIDQLRSSDGSSGSKESDRVRIHGYGEMHFNHGLNDDGSTSIDNHRYVIGVHAKLTDWIHLNAEIDFEHAAQELEFEMAYLDFLLSSNLNVRAGVMLMPIGFLNEYHEPPLFWTVERPELQSKIIPTTFSAAGAGIFGSLSDGINYRFYVVNSLQSLRETEFDDGSGNGAGGASGQFRGEDGIRKGRLQINKAIAEDFAGVGRLELTKLYPGLQLGFSAYYGNTTHDIINEDGTVLLLEADVRYRLNWFEMNSTIVNIDVDDAAAINAFCASASGECTSDVAENMFGWNIQAGIHVPQLMGIKTTQDVIPYVLYENIRPQDAMPTGTAGTAKNNFEVITTGLAYLPIASVSIKLDYQHFMFGDNTSKDMLNMGLAYMF
jgi:hypothetical protein